MNYFNNFVIIDDEKLNNHICTNVIKGLYRNATIKDFTDPKLGFKHLVDEYSKADIDDKVILFLDIMMPIMNAWDFLEEFEKQNDILKNNVKIYILSSSVSKSDMARANANPYVEYYLIKPLTKESIRLMVHTLHRKLDLPTP